MKKIIVENKKTQTITDEKNKKRFCTIYNNDKGEPINFEFHNPVVDKLIAEHVYVSSEIENLKFMRKVLNTIFKE